MWRLCDDLTRRLRRPSVPRPIRARRQSSLRSLSCRWAAGPVCRADPGTDHHLGEAETGTREAAARSMTRLRSLCPRLGSTAAAPWAGAAAAQNRPRRRSPEAGASARGRKGRRAAVPARACAAALRVGCLGRPAWLYTVSSAGKDQIPDAQPRLVWRAEHRAAAHSRGDSSRAILED